MKIGNGTDVAWNNTGKGIAANGKNKRTGAAGLVPTDKEVEALRDYEAYQRQAFEAGYHGESAEWLDDRLRALAEEAGRPKLSPLRQARIRAETWAVTRVLRARIGTTS